MDDVRAATQRMMALIQSNREGLGSKFSVIYRDELIQDHLGKTLSVMREVIEFEQAQVISTIEVARVDIETGTLFLPSKSAGGVPSWVRFGDVREIYPPPKEES